MTKSNKSGEKNSMKKWVVEQQGRPNDCDVILGRGKQIEGWPGNVRFRNLVNERAATYCLSQRADQRDAIADGIVAAIEERGGRFLQISKGGDLLHRVLLISKAAATAKVKQALRDRMRAHAESKGRLSVTPLLAQQTALSVSDFWNIEPIPFNEGFPGNRHFDEDSSKIRDHFPEEINARPAEPKGKRMDQRLISWLLEEPHIQKEDQFSWHQRPKASLGQNHIMADQGKPSGSPNNMHAMIHQSPLDIQGPANEKFGSDLQYDIAPSCPHPSKQDGVVAPSHTLDQHRQSRSPLTAHARDDNFSESSTLEYDWDSDDLFLSADEDDADDHALIFVGC